VCCTGLAEPLSGGPSGARNGGDGVERDMPDLAEPRAGARIDALAQLASAEVALRRTARRYSLCADDAEDAYQRAVEILLTRAPSADPRHLAAWMQVVTRREALALRRSRERLLGRHADDAGDPLERIACERPDPQERLERRERVTSAIRLLFELKPQERRALVLQAHGYSYAEIGRLCGWTYTKVNRCLAEGRARLRQLGTCT
jgi:RNA polymerase sigma factor (sigma-70 family)